jgi:hypothetical protein
MTALRGKGTKGDDADVPTLAQLISESKTDIGLSYDQLAARTGYVVTRQRFQQLGTSKRLKEFPEPATLAAVAEALKLDVALVVLATAKSIGLSVDMGSRSDLGMMLPSAARNLTRDQRNALLSLVRSIVAEDSGARSPVADSPVTENQRKKLPFHPRGAVAPGPGETGVEDRDENRQ